MQPSGLLGLNGEREALLKRAASEELCFLLLFVLKLAFAFIWQENVIQMKAVKSIYPINDSFS